MEIILVEDNKGDEYLIKYALKVESINIKVISDGGKAISYLTSDCVRPDLVILDLNLPHYNGFQILEAIRNFDPIKGVPVVFFTSSTSLDDMKKAYNLGVSKFYSKTFNNEEYFKRVKSFLELIQKK
jgi:two-component system response regulator